MIRRVILTGLTAIALTGTFVVALAAGLLLHLGLPASRRVVIAQTNQILATSLAGKVEIEKLDRLGLSGLDGVSVRVSDPEGVPVVHLVGLTVRIESVAAARSAISGSGPIAIVVPAIRIDNVDANLDANGAGKLRIAEAFGPKTKEPPKPEEPPGRGVRVETKLDLHHAWIHGTPPNAVLVDVDLDDVAIGAHVDPTIVRANLDRLRFSARGLPRKVDPQGTLVARLALPMEDTSAMDVEATFDGAIGAMPTKAEAKMSGRKIDARIDTADATGANAAALAPEVQLHEALSLHAEAHGELPRLDTRAKIALGRATVDAEAALVLGDATNIDAKLSARHVDLHGVLETAPKSDLGLDAQAKVSLGSTIEGTAAIDGLPGTIAVSPKQEERVPPIRIRAEYVNGKADADVKIDEASAPTTITVKTYLRTDGQDGQQIVTSVRMAIPDLRRVPMIGAAAGASGAVSIGAQARLLLPEKTFDARANVAARGLVKDTLRANAIDVSANASGNIERPAIDVELTADSLSAGDMVVADTKAKAHLEIDGAKITVDGPAVDLVRADVPIGIRARRVRVDGDTVRVEEAVIDGLGDPIRADVVKGPELRASIDAPRIELVKVAAAADKPDLIAAGTLGVTGEVTLRGSEVETKSHIVLSDVSAFDVQHVNATLDASIDRRNVGLDLEAALADAGTIRLRTRDVRLGGPATVPASWTRGRGSVDLESDVDLGKVLALVPPGKLPLSELGGTLALRGRIGRDNETALPETTLHVQTTGLVIGGASTTETTVTTWRSPDVDVALDLRTDAPSGQASVAVRATDARGNIVAFDAKSVLPFETIVANPSGAKAAVLAAPLSAKLVIPSRRFDQLPSVLGIHSIEGSTDAELDVAGTALEPKVRFVAHARGLHVGAMPPALKPDADIGLDYDGKAVAFTTKIRDGGRTLADATAHVDVRASDLVEGKPDLPWKASARARLAAFPLESLYQLADQHVRGNVSAEIALDDLHGNGRFHGKINLERLAVGKASYERGSVTVDAENGSLEARVRVDQADGHLEAKATAGLVWGAAVAPSIDESRPVVAKLNARSFRALVAQPFVEEAVPTLDGFIDADAGATILAGQAPKLEGKVAFRDGRVQLAALGDELRKVRATATMSADGTIRVSDVSASGVQGAISADALVKLDGMRLASANANVRIGEGKPFDLAIDGTPIGDVTGTVKINAAQRADTLAVVVEVPKLSVELPQSMKSTVHGLDEKKNVQVGVLPSGKPDDQNFAPVVRRKSDTEPPDSEEKPASVTAVDVHLGKITIDRPNSAQISLSGHPKISLGKTTQMSGQIRLDGGWANVQGKKFEIERGTVTFTEETPPNPVVVATAGWTAPNGTRVYAEFVGPVKTGKVTLRSEPAMPKDAILGLILFGSADGANPTQRQSGRKPKQEMQAAQSLGGGLVAQGLTQALDDLAGIKANARIDTSRANNPRPEIEFQLSPKVAVGFSHVLGTPPITEPDKNLARVDWRVYRNWSLETTVGDKGRAMFDAIWQRRY